MSDRVLLLTGAPGSGKTTVLRRLAANLRDRGVAGFFTEEIRDQQGKRGGFRAVTLAGERWTIAHRDFSAPPRVGRYGVALSAVDRLGDVLDEAITNEARIVLVDEIGKMECLSHRFVEAMKALLSSPLLVVATVAYRGGGLVADVKARQDAVLWEVTRNNRDALPGRAADWLASRAGRTSTAPE